MDCFDADVLIFAATPGHPLGRRVRALFAADDGASEGDGARCGSVLLLPELLSKPVRDNAVEQTDALMGLLARLRLLPVDQMTAGVSVILAATYGLRAADATHLATAVVAGADRFVTNNREDFPKSVIEVNVTYPTDLEDPSAATS